MSAICLRFLVSHGPRLYFTDWFLKVHPNMMLSIDLQDQYKNPKSNVAQAKSAEEFFDPIPENEFP
jgi:hypothetical protein